MSSTAYQTVPVTCPKCGNRFVAPVLSLIDATHSPDAKSMLLSGQLNVAVCPQCGQAGMLSVPLVYHDRDKELLFTFLPDGLGASEAERQRMIGDATNRLLSSLPSEQRKGYLFRPRTFMRLEGMIEAILEADGITPEMLQAHRARVALLERLLRAANEDARRAMARENDTLIDYEFFQLLALNQSLAESDGESAVVAQVQALRDQLLQWTAFGRETASRRAAIESLGPEVTREDLLSKLVDAALQGEQAKIETMVTVARQAIDYAFFQQLTQRIEALKQAGQADDARALESLRSTILDLVSQIDAEIRQAAEQAWRFLEEVLSSEHPEQTLREQADRVDEFFLSVLGSQLDAAERDGRADMAERLGKLAAVLMQLLQEGQPPEIQVINELMAASFPDGTREVLERHAGETESASFLDILQMVADNLSEDGHHDAADHLARVRKQAEALCK